MSSRETRDGSPHENTRRSIAWEDVCPRRTRIPPIPPARPSHTHSKSACTRKKQMASVSLTSRGRGASPGVYIHDGGSPLRECGACPRIAEIGRRWGGGGVPFPFRVACRVQTAVYFRAPIFFCWFPSPAHLLRIAAVPVDVEGDSTAGIPGWTPDSFFHCAIYIYIRITAVRTPVRADRRPRPDPRGPCGPPGVFSTEVVTCVPIPARDTGSTQKHIG
ncbi:uncharacterized protein EV422DRAFT_231689 [Fimicolochytrium jonesii]|uniref:uncharacterized protein n=1 Tax=Fimicolochytrium jonesii TaxID=1396493 RepID=UPI0022FDE042|nr:uncharacterized protein EV422DRAFT_231689 [Fimicolochytrium jonesii]KAI8817312.1 hypothetical protein EV422DRAFT_231689 [Fimicolochytrium jonesii]